MKLSWQNFLGDQLSGLTLMMKIEIFEMLAFSSALTLLIAREDFRTFMKIISIQRDTCGQMDTHSEGNGSISHWKHTTKGSCIVKS
jgi:hypothetical protein